jgi:26S proteasome regulatory subunit N7
MLKVVQLYLSTNVIADYRDLSKFIASGRLNCVIDKVNGIIETNRPDNKNAQYQTVIKQGDVLLNRVQKLSRVINV